MSTTTTATTTEGSDKVAKLQHATDAARAVMIQKEREYKDAQERLDVAKLLLQSMDAQDQQKITLGDTKLPELLALCQMAKDEYETSLKRYETNQRYLHKFTGGSTVTAATATDRPSNN